MYSVTLPFHPTTVYSTPTYFQHDVTLFIISLLLLQLFYLSLKLNFNCFNNKLIVIQIVIFDEQ